MNLVRIIQAKLTLFFTKVFDRIIVMFEIRACHRYFIIEFLKFS